ncbi:hypothetical protein MW887_010717 [Aspergillus wentii]|nr:hypothetical protein MW887_010717 [Aspergillus wentii]
MDTLPSPVLLSICSLIWETSPRTLRLFSLVNSNCYHASVPFLYRKLKLEVSTHQRLQDAVSELIVHPLRQQYLAYARQLNLQGKLFRQAESPEDEAELLQRQELFSEREPQSDICSELEMEPSYDLMLRSDQNKLEDAEKETSPSWLPLASLLARLQYLLEMNYTCENMFPPCLLEALSQYHPSCRLSLDMFRFTGCKGQETNPYEMKLIHSPCLHAVTMRFPNHSSESQIDYDEEAVIEAIKTAPNLKEVRLHWCLSQTTNAVHQNLDSPQAGTREVFNPVSIPEEHRPRKSLTSLSLKGASISMERLEKWSQVTDLSKLQSLTMDRVSNPFLSLVTETAAFTSLEKLSMTFGFPRDNEHIQPLAETFFESLPPLKTLRLHRFIGVPLLQKILERHGPSLRELLFKPFGGSIGPPQIQVKPIVLTASDIAHVAELCPLVEQLDLSLHRFQGNYRETACYEALGKFQSLKKVSLDLNYVMPFAQPRTIDDLDESMDELDRQRYGGPCTRMVYNIDACDAMTNAAVDEKLARSIWDVITSSQSGNNRLLSLCIMPRKAIVAGYVSLLIPKVKHIARSFKVTWHGYGNHVDVFEIGKKRREREDKERRQYEADMIRERGSFWDLRDEIFERLWPQSEGQHWHDSWSSFPLKRSS